MPSFDQRPLSTPVVIRGAVNVPAHAIASAVAVGFVALGVLDLVNNGRLAVFAPMNFGFAFLIVLTVAVRLLAAFARRRTLQVTLDGVILATPFSRRFVPDAAIRGVQHSLGLTSGGTPVGRLTLTVGDEPGEVVRCEYALPRGGLDPLAPLVNRFVGDISRRAAEAERVEGPGWFLAGDDLDVGGARVSLAAVSAVVRIDGRTSYYASAEESPFLVVPDDSPNAAVLQKLTLAACSARSGFGRELSATGRGRLLLEWRPPWKSAAGGACFLAGMFNVFFALQAGQGHLPPAVPPAIFGATLLVVAAYVFHVRTSRLRVYEHAVRLDTVVGSQELRYEVILSVELKPMPLLTLRAPMGRRITAFSIEGVRDTALAAAAGVISARVTASREKMTGGAT